MRVLVCTLLATGCDALFSIRTIEPGDTDAAVVGAIYIASGDADGDGIPNKDDPCPLDATPNSNQDSDGDGVGDTCDPNLPPGGGDCLVFFEDFAHATVLDPRWRAVANVDRWELKTGCTTDGTFALCSPVAAYLTYAYFDDALSVGAVMIDADVGLLGSTATSMSFLAFDQLEPNGNDVSGRGCGIGRDPPDGHGVIIVDDLLDGVPAVMQHAMTTLEPDTGERVRLDWRPAAETCTFTLSGVPASTTMSERPPSTGRFVGWRNTHLDVGIRTIAGYSTACPKR